MNASMTGSNLGVGDLLANGDLGGREIPPWADPLVDRVLTKHRLEAALADSLSFLAQDQKASSLRENRFPTWKSVSVKSDS